ncbi:DUF6247 family protein [Nonomuraea sp. NPDC049158]|uniref:DUF6247 family protein n=1 Tax=Nonomuraea sp. NPDC049158 TaxID=3155649 RepID=UPI0033C15B9C
MSAQPHGTRRTPEEIRASLKDDRSPKAIRTALPAEDHVLFDREYRTALDQAKISYDLAPIQEFQTRWWMTAVLKADPNEYAETLQAGERAAEYYERGERPPGATRWDDAVDADLRERIKRGQ